MHRFAIVFLVLSIAARTASANVVDVMATDTWSATSSWDAFFNQASADTTSNLNFNLSQIPTGSTITSATLTILDTTTNWKIAASGFDSGAPPVPPLTFFGEAEGNSDILGDGFLDFFNVMGCAPNSPVCTDLLFAGSGGGPYAIDPSAIPAHGTYSVPIEASGDMEFVAFDPGNPQQSGSPQPASFTMNGTVDGELEVQFSPGQTSTTPEPGYGVLLGMLLIPLAGGALRRRRAVARQPE
jgi:hypothetical protein